jgi:hypothetical protein
MENTRDDDIPVPVIYGEHQTAGNYVFEKEPGSVKYTESIDTSDNVTQNIYILSCQDIDTYPIPVVTFHFSLGEDEVEPDQPSYTFDYDAGRVIATFGDDVPSWVFVTYYATPTNVTDIKFGIAVSEGPIESIANIEADKIPIDSISESSYNVYLGTGTQTADSRNPNAENLRYTAYEAFSFKANKQISGNNPNITSIVRGRIVKVYDSATSTWVERWTQNPAYCVLDFMTNTRYGCGINEDQIDLDSFVEVANYCDGLADDGNGGTEVRYRLDIILDTRNPAPDNLDTMLNTFGGFVTWSDGEYHLKCEKGELPSGEFTDQGEFPNIVEESDGNGGKKTTLQIAESSSDSVPNRLIVEFMNPEYSDDGSWGMSKIIYNDDIDQEQRGETVEKTIKLLGVTRKSQAGRMLKMYYDKLRRCSKTVQFRAPISCMDVEAGDIRYITHRMPGWNKKMIRITAVGERDDDEIEITRQLYDPNIYHDLAVPYVEVKAPSRPNPFFSPNVTNLVANESHKQLGDGTCIPEVILTFTKPNYPYYTGSAVYLSEDGGTTITKYGIAYDSPYVITNLVKGKTYRIYVSAMSQNVYEKLISLVPYVDVQVLGKTDPPPIPSILSVRKSTKSLIIFI